MEDATLDLAAITGGLFGGLAMFLYGLDKMTTSLKTVAGSGMRNVLARLTSNRISAAFSGAFVTAVVQSSSVTTVLLVGFISAGLMTLGQSVGVIMGANIGTTFTAQIIAFKVTQYGLPLLTLGFLVTFVARADGVRQAGAILMGFGMVFYGMDLMGHATQPLRSYEPFIRLIGGIDSPGPAILAAAVFTALVQSSSATTAIVIMLAGQGFISLETGIALALGANIGTCATALLAAIGKPRSALQAAMVHVLFNVVGVLIWIGLIPELAEIVQRISPVYPDLTGSARLGAEVPRQIANAHSVFNVANTVLLLPFSNGFAILVQRLIPDRPKAAPRATPHFLDESFISTPSLAVDRIRLEVGHLGEMALRVEKHVEARPVDLEALQEAVADAESVYGAIVEYARRVLQQETSPSETEGIERLLASANHFHSIADTISINLGSVFGEAQSRRLQASPETDRRFTALLSAVGQAIQDVATAVAEDDVEKAESVVRRKHEIADSAESLEQHLAERLTAEGPDRLALYRIESEIVEVAKRLYYFAKRVAKNVAVEAPEPELPIVEEAPAI